MFERFTENARRVVALAQEESRLLRHHDIRAEHLLLGLLRLDDDVARTVLAVTLAAAHQAAAVSSPPETMAPGGHIPFTTNAKRDISVLTSLGVDRVVAEGTASSLCVGGSSLLGSPGRVPVMAGQWRRSTPISRRDGVSTMTR